MFQTPTGDKSFDNAHTEKYAPVFILQTTLPNIKITIIMLKVLKNNELAQNSGEKTKIKIS